MKKLIIFLLLSVSIYPLFGQERLNKNLFEHHIICQQLKLYDDSYYLKTVNNWIYYYDKTSGKQIKSINGVFPQYTKSHSINNGQGIMYNLERGYSYYTYCDWANHYRAKIGATVDSGYTWKEIADFDEIFTDYSHKNEHIFVPDSNILIVYGMRSVFELKKQYTTERYKSVMVDNIEFTCLPNRDGFVNVDRFNHISVQNYIYVSHDGGKSWISAKVPHLFISGFSYNNDARSTFNGAQRSNMLHNSLNWFETKENMYIISLKNGNQIKSKDQGLTWK